MQFGKRERFGPSAGLASGLSESNNREDPTAAETSSAASLPGRPSLPRNKGATVATEWRTNSPLTHDHESPPMNSYSSLCDDFGVSSYLHSKLDMPTGREPVLHFFEAVQKAVPKMTEFEKRS